MRHQEDKQSKATSSLFPIKIVAKLVLDTKLRTIKHRTITESHNGSNSQQRINNESTSNQQQQNHCLRVDSSLSHCILLVPDLHPIDSVVIKAQKTFRSHGGFLNIAICHHRETIFVCLFVCFVALRPKSTAMVIAGRSVNLTTLFPGQA